MPRDKFTSWPTWFLLVLCPPVLVLAIVFLPVTILVVLWLYTRGRHQAMEEARATDHERSPARDADRRR